MDTVKIKAPISERDISRIRPGLNARIRVDAYPREVFQGVVRLISPTIDPASRSGDVEIVAANPDYRLKPGMFAKISLALEERHNVLLVPRQALRLRGNEASVFVVQDNKAHLRRVTMGLQNDTQVEIVDALTLGVIIIVAGHHKLKDKAPIKIVQNKEGS
jgi:RND family efflux transporter MFP subunit